MRALRFSAVVASTAIGLALGACRTVPVEAPRGTRAERVETDAGAGGDARLALGAVDGNRTDFFATEKLAARTDAERAAWGAYRSESARLGESDRALVEAELRALHRTTMTRAPFQKAFQLDESMTDEWFHGDKAGHLADNMLSFQTPSGGWSKHVDYEPSPRQPGESFYSETDSWQYIATVDNDSTTEQLRFMARAFAARGDVRYRNAFGRGIEYLLRAQFPNGCWPQVFPLQGGYHDAGTFNDNAIINVLSLLRDVAAGQFDFVPQMLRAEASASVDRGTSCILESQTKIGGVLAVWAQQVDPLTLAPVSARSYELAGQSGRESAVIVAYLMAMPSPSPRVVEAVHAAIAWFKAHQIFGYEYDSYALRKVEGAGPLWSRLYELDTDRPIFSNRDGVKRYDWNELTDRRRGYMWFTKEPRAPLAAYDGWAKGHPRATSAQ